MASPELPDYAVVNRASWTKANAEYADARAHAAWAAPQIRWGVFGVPEEEVSALPEVEGADVVELGCGTAYIGAKLKRRGARRVVGVDVTPAQLDTARRMVEEFRLGIELVEANAEETGLPEASFDLAVSEYGASIWCDPYKWIPEAARLLRPGGELVFLCNSALSILCAPDDGQVVGEQLLRPQRGLHRLDWQEGDDAGVEFHLGHGDMVRLLAASGFELLDLIELFAPDDATDHEYYTYVPAEWAKQWPAEEIWRARKRS
jgi:SAM-dependent methyltransferase